MPSETQKAAQGGGEVIRTRAAHKARVTVQPEHGRDPVLTQELHERLPGSLGMIVLVDVGTQQDRGAGVYTVKNLDYVLALAFSARIRRDRRGILEIDLDLAPRGSRRSPGRFLR
jgi:hypothetical protein